jgi:DNA (cytosine-5)-methyltransferase 1
MNELALFAGAGGGLLGGTLLGWRTVAAVEIEEYPRAVLLQRQADGILPRFPVWDDVRTFDGKPWRGKVDVITGGFPCQDISAAGKGAGITGKRSGLWSEFARIIGEVRPAYVLVENSPMLISRGLDVVLSDLAALGYDAEWGIIGAHHARAPHKRDRIWIVANANGCGSREDIQYCKLWPSMFEQSSENPGQANAGEDGERQGRIQWWDRDPADIPDTWSDATWSAQRDKGWGDRPGETAENLGGWGILRGDAPDDYRLWPAESRLGRVAHGVAHRVDRLKAIGNGQVPAVVALAWEILGHP